MRLDSVPVLLTDWPWVHFRSDHEGLILGPALFHLFHWNWKNLSWYSTLSNNLFPSLFIHLSAFWWSLFLSHSVEGSRVLYREPDGYFKDVWETYWIFLQEKWLITDKWISYSTPQPLSLPQTARSSKFYTISWPDIYLWAKAGSTLLLWSSRGRDG